MGQYSHLRDKYPRLPPTSSFDDFVRAAKDKIIRTADEGKYHLTIGEVARRIFELRERKAKLEEQVSELNVGITAYEELFFEKAEAQDVQLVRLDNGGSVSWNVEPKLQVEDPAKFRQWCIDNGLEGSLKLDWQTGNSLLKERLMNGEAEMDGCKAFMVNKIRVNKPRG